MSILFGDYIRGRRQLRRERSPEYSIRQVAKRIGIHHSYLSKVERGEPATLSERSVQALARELEENPDLLMAMNGKLSEELRRAVFDAPELFLSFVRQAKSKSRSAMVDCEMAVLHSLRNMHVVQLNKDMNIVWTHENGECARDLDGYKCYEGFFGAEGPCESCPVIRTLKNGMYNAGEVVSVDGNVRLVASSPLFNGGVTVVGAVNVVVDVTNGQKMERFYKETRQLLLHDIRSPLAGIINMLRLMQDQNNFESEHVDTLTVMIRTAELLLNQVSMALDVEHIESGQMKPRPSMVNVAELIHLLAQRFDKDERFRGVDLAVTFKGRPLGKDEMVWAKVDSGMTMRLLSGLMTNAFEASSVGDTVRVEMENGKSLSFRISNSKEVPWEVRDSFFEKYSTVGKSGGLGLGAYGAKVMAESMGGVIDYTSSKGDGTTVCVTLPSLVVYT
nr:ATP-binding protein [uncultured Pseudodesulfovibrio sp.]